MFLTRSDGVVDAVAECHQTGKVAQSGGPVRICIVAVGKEAHRQDPCVSANRLDTTRVPANEIDRDVPECWQSRGAGQCVWTAGLRQSWERAETRRLVSGAVRLLEICRGAAR